MTRFFRTDNANWTRSTMGFQQLILCLIVGVASATHYGNPTDGCESDEVPVSITGITGKFCAPDCQSASCPTDVPAGVTATPQCALKASTGSDKKCTTVHPSPPTNRLVKAVSHSVKPGPDVIGKTEGSWQDVSAGVRYLCPCGSRWLRIDSLATTFLMPILPCLLVYHVMIPGVPSKTTFFIDNQRWAVRDS